MKTRSCAQKEKNILEAADKKLIEIMGKEKFKSRKEKTGLPHGPKHKN
jgi:hypothetical protein